MTERACCACVHFFAKIPAGRAVSHLPLPFTLQTVPTLTTTTLLRRMTQISAARSVLKPTQKRYRTQMHQKNHIGVSALDPLYPISQNSHI